MRPISSADWRSVFAALEVYGSAFVVCGRGATANLPLQEWLTCVGAVAPAKEMDFMWRDRLSEDRGCGKIPLRTVGAALTVRELCGYYDAMSKRLVTGELNLAHGGLFCAKDLGQWTAGYLDDLVRCYRDRGTKWTLNGYAIKLPAWFRLLGLADPMRLMPGYRSRLLPLFEIVPAHARFDMTGMWDR